MNEYGGLSGRVALITGGGSGIGEATAKLFAARGAKVVVADIVPARAQEVAKAVDGIALTVDVGSEDSIRAMADQCEKEAGVPDIFVANAGIFQLPLPPGELGVERWDAVMNIDQRGVYISTTVIGERMAKLGRGSIVAVASITGVRSAPLHAYAVAKASVIHMVSCLSAEWGNAGVRINAVSPGYTLTPALKGQLDRGERDVRNLTSFAALGRLVLPDEVARSIAFLASDEASAITGTNLIIDAGLIPGASWSQYGGPRAAS